MARCPDDFPPPDESIPPGLHEALVDLYRREVRVPPDVDDAILSAARAGYARRRRAWRTFRWAGTSAAAAAAVLALAVYLRMPAPRGGHGPGAAPEALGLAGDINGDGRVDILDAFSLARALRAGGRLEPGWDVNGDGRIDEQDVQWIARQAVRVGGERLQ